MSPRAGGLHGGWGLSSPLTLSMGLFCLLGGALKEPPVSGGGAPFQEGTGQTGLIFAGDGVLAVCPWGLWEILIDVFNIRKLRHRTSRGLKKTCSSVSGQGLGLGSKWPGSRGVFDSLPPRPQGNKRDQNLDHAGAFCSPQGG